MTLPVAVESLFSNTKVLLNDISGEARDGEIMAMLGASGSGKSTLNDALANRITKGSLKGTVTLNEAEFGLKYTTLSVITMAMEEPKKVEAELPLVPAVTTMPEPVKVEVPLIGFCVEKSHGWILVYKYMCNGSLDIWIYHQNVEGAFCKRMEQKLVEMMKVAACCLQNDYVKRPSKSVVVKVLEGVREVQ
ncbi:hypothetical protein LguiA_022224 [Lonicera macranthoides]